MPVHSSAMSTPRSFHGSFDGSRSAETLILPLPRLRESPSTVTVPGKRPCTESKRTRWRFPSPFLRQAQPSAQALQGSVNRSLGGNSEVLVKVLGRRAGAETMHAYEFTIVADHGVPAPAHRGLD